jgi:hypothetical protein
VHDDYLMADALTAELDGLLWAVSTPTLVVPWRDAIEEMSSSFRPEGGGNGDF